MTGKPKEDLQFLEQDLRKDEGDAAAEVTNDMPNEYASGVERPVASSFGRLKINDCGTSYKASHHWATILDEVVELNDLVEVSDEINGMKEESPGLALLSGGLALTSKTEVFAYLPKRSLADRIISCYHKSKEPASLILHWPTFLEEYNDFWTSSSKADHTWTALLFGMLSLGTHIMRRSGDISCFDLDPQELASLYRIKSAQCLLLADYVKKPGRYTVQTLLVYLLTESVRSNDALAEIWSLNGLTVGLALRLGLHRDPEHYPELTAFQGEMRRRVWALLFQIDLMFSYQIGLPRIARPSESDTKLPRNLQDEDIYEDMASLPPSRPDTDLTPTSYTRAKGRIAHAFSQISDAIFSVNKTPFEEVMQLDKGLEAAHDAIPPFLQMKERSLAFTDPPYLIMQRYNIDLLYLKSRCALHRKSLVEATVDVKYQQSKSICVQTALSLLDRQFSLDLDCQAGGLLEKDNWFVSSFTTADFLLAAMILCVDVCYERSRFGAVPWDHRLQAIERSYGIWVKTSLASKEAEKAAKVISVILAKARGEPISSVDPAPLSFSGEIPALPEFPSDHQSGHIEEPFEWVSSIPPTLKYALIVFQANWDISWLSQLSDQTLHKHGG